MNCKRKKKKKIMFNKINKNRQNHYQIIGKGIASKKKTGIVTKSRKQWGEKLMDANRAFYEFEEDDPQSFPEIQEQKGSA